MTNREFNALKDRLKKHAGARDIAQIFESMGYKDPYTIESNRLVLPSAIKEKAIEQIERWFRDGKLKAKKNG